MTFTYDGDPSESSLEEVRFLVGDTDKDEPLLQDEEIEYLLSVFPDPGEGPAYITAAAAASAIAAKFSKQMDKSVGRLSIQYTQRHKQFVEMSDKFTNLAKYGPSGKRPVALGRPELFGGGETYLGSDDSPLSYEDDDVTAEL